MFWLSAVQSPPPPFAASSSRLRPNMASEDCSPTMPSRAPRGRRARVLMPAPRAGANQPGRWRPWSQARRAAASSTLGNGGIAGASESKGRSGSEGRGARRKGEQRSRVGQRGRRRARPNRLPNPKKRRLHPKKRRPHPKKSPQNLLRRRKKLLPPRRLVPSKRSSTTSEARRPGSEPAGHPDGRASSSRFHPSPSFSLRQLSEDGYPGSKSRL